MDVFGLDLGSSYSCLAICYEDGRVAVRSNNGQNFIPSVVSYTQDGVIVGWPAQQNLLDPLYCRSTFSYVKRLMNKDYLDQRIEILGNRFVSPIEIQAAIVKKIIDDENYARKVENREPLTRGVITIPSRFGDIERNKVRTAAMLAGIHHVDLVHEPTAAAIAYFQQNNFGIVDRQKILVFDLGGGTLDISILDYHEKEKDYVVLKSEGFREFGGRDFDRHLLFLALQLEGGGLSENDYEQCRELWEDNLLKAEQCKINLSVNYESSIRINLPDGRTKPIRITQVQFMEACSDLIEMIEPKLRQTIGDINIESFILSGGACQMPMMKTYLNNLYKSMCGFDKDVQIFEPEFSIAKGAAFIARMYSDASGRLVDRGTKAYGLRVQGNEVVNFIKMGDPLIINPTKIMLQAPPSSHSQALHFEVYEHTIEGERVKLSQLDINDNKKYENGIMTPSDRSEGDPVILTFSRDNSGIVHFRADYNGKDCKWESPIEYNLEKELKNTILKSLSNLK